MTTKVVNPTSQETEHPSGNQADVQKESFATVLRLLFAATVSTLTSSVSSAVSARPDWLRQEGTDVPSELAQDEPSWDEPAGAEGPDIARFDLHQRIQHILMFTSFTVLAATGLPQKFHEFGPSQWLIASLGGIEMTQTIHHIAAFVMLFDCLYHGLYIVRGVLQKKDINPFRMIPTPKDFADAIQMFLYFLGVSTRKPKFDRYSYLEKFDYWAVFWGIFIIGGSGIVLLFPVQITKLLPGQIVPVALAAHSDEAVLAVGWIFLVHLFYAHLAPAIFPFNTSIFTGRVPRERYKEEHPLDYRRILVAERRQQVKAQGGPQITLPVGGGAPAEVPDAESNPDPELTSNGQETNETGDLGSSQ